MSVATAWAFRSAHSRRGSVYLLIRPSDDRHPVTYAMIDPHDGDQLRAALAAGFRVKARVDAITDVRRTLRRTRKIATVAAALQLTTLQQRDD